MGAAPASQDLAVPPEKPRFPGFETPIPSSCSRNGLGFFSPGGFKDAFSTLVCHRARW